MESSTGSKIVVAESGNKRKTISAEDVEQCIKDIAGWYQTKAENYYTNKLKTCAGAPPEEVKAVLGEFSAADSHLSVQLTKYNGGFQYLDTYVGLTLDEIRKHGGELGLLEKKIVPFAKDIDGTLQCLQITDGGKESVISWDCESNAVQEDLKVTYAEYIESIREKLLTGKLEYEEDLGLVTV